MKNFLPNPEGRNVLGIRTELKFIQGYGGDVAPPNNRFYAGGEGDIRGFEVRSTTPYAYIPNKINFNLSNPDGSCVPRDPNNPQLGQCIQVPLPVYSVVSVGAIPTSPTISSTASPSLDRSHSPSSMTSASMPRPSANS